MGPEDRIFEEYLVTAARAGDRAAFAKLVEMRGPRLLTHAVRLLGEREAALDAVQDAWVEILKGLGRLDDARAFPAWAYRIVTRRCARTVRGKMRVREIAARLDAEPPAAARDDGEAAADARAVRSAIRELPPAQAATVALFYLDELSVAEVATALDIPPGTVKTRLMHARDKLAKALKGATHEQA